jgi:hypothetical protein
VSGLTAGELRTLGSLTARLLPGPPEDPDPGALELGAADAINLLLDAFAAEQPPIHAAADGGFVPLDAVAELGWRIRIEGSRGLPEREFAGPVKGLADTVREGLELLDRRSHDAYGAGFADGSAEAQDRVLDGAGEDLAAFVRLVLMLTLDAVYGPPQYGGNRDGMSWQALGWPGFLRAPRGFTPAQVSEPDGEGAGSLEVEAVSELRAGLADDAGWQSGSV